MSHAREAVLGPVRPDEVPDFVAAFTAVFGNTASDRDVERFRRVADPARLVAARDPAGTIVGTAGAYDFELSLPGAAPVGCAGVTLVSVRGDFRRRGLMTGMLAHLLDDAEVRGEPFAALWASESPIYGRFGFGPAAPTLHVELRRPHAALHLAGPVSDVRLVDEEEAVAAFPAIYAAHRAQRIGMLSRSEAWWRRELADPPDRRDGAGPKRFALLAGRGYAVHRFRGSWSAGAPDGKVEVQELVANDPEATAALWRFLVETDLAASVTAGRRPVDDPIVALLRDSARAQVEHDWPLYLRLVDVPAALAARRYPLDDTLVLDVRDQLRPSNAGRWRLVVREGVATCEPAPHADGDVALGVTELATIAVGGVRPSMLAAAGRLEGDPAVVARLGRLFAADPAPWHGGMF